jgi:hypothetical protein
MPLPQHPDHHDDPPTRERRRKRTILVAIGLIVVLASLHVVRQAL